MDRFIELMEKEDRNELEELEYIYLDRCYQLNALIKTAKRLGNKNYTENFIIKNAYESYQKAKQNYENAKAMAI